jgi:hypothetical protein
MKLLLSAHKRTAGMTGSEAALPAGADEGRHAAAALNDGPEPVPGIGGYKSTLYANSATDFWLNFLG